MKNIDSDKVESIASSYLIRRQTGQSHEQAEAAVRKLASENCDSSQIERGIDHGIRYFAILK